MATPPLKAATAPAGQPSPVRVAIVDDAVVIRGLMSRWFSEAGGFEVVGTYRNGIDAIANIPRANPDLVVLDIEMPDMDGVTALPIIRKLRPGVTVLIASTLSVRSADISLRCLSLGASDYIAKPSTQQEVTTSQAFRTELIEKARVLCWREPRDPPARRPGAARPAPAPEDAPPLRAPSTAPLQAIAIGASTGGPQAVLKLLGLIAPLIETVPVLVAQHMPATFTSMFAEHLRRQIAIDAVEAVDQEPIRPGRVYVAPGGKHMRVAPHGQGARVAIGLDGAINFCRPSVDALFESAAAVYGPRLAGVSLTGMGTDGAQMAMRIVEAGGTMLAQDKASSVVWGMPGAAARSGACALVGDVGQIAEMLMRLGKRTLAP
jgi:two-component system chemotaxis response regulator CheB